MPQASTSRILRQEHAAPPNPGALARREWRAPSSELGPRCAFIRRDYARTRWTLQHRETFSSAGRARRKTMDFPTNCLVMRSTHWRSSLSSRKGKSCVSQGPPQMRSGRLSGCSRSRPEVLPRVVHRSCRRLPAPHPGEGVPCADRRGSGDDGGSSRNATLPRSFRAPPRRTREWEYGVFGRNKGPDHELSLAVRAMLVR